MDTWKLQMLHNDLYLQIFPKGQEHFNCTKFIINHCHGLLLAHIREALWTGWGVSEQSGSALGAQFPPEVKARQGQKLGRGYRREWKPQYIRKQLPELLCKYFPAFPFLFLPQCFLPQCFDLGLFSSSSTILCIPPTPIPETAGVKGKQDCKMNSLYLHWFPAPSMNRHMVLI